MKPRLHPIQAAWLGEIGVDLHGFDIRSAADLPRRATAAAGDRLRADAAAGPVAENTVTNAGMRPDVAAGQSVAGDAAVRVDCLPDLASLALAVQDCRRCVRHEQRIRAVPGAGSAPHPQYLVVGEQPGIGDEVGGLPFQGDAGRLLEAMLAAVRLPQAQSIHHTYAVKCRAAVGREPDATEVAACLPHLHREIALLRPRWILALGRVAAQAVLGVQSDLDALRGGPHRYTLDAQHEIPVWVTHQPASLLVRSTLKAEAWRDLVGLAQAVRAAAGEVR